MKVLLTKKLGMTTIYKEGVADNVTLLEAGENAIVALRSEEKDGYVAVQVGIDKSKNEKKGFDVHSEFRMGSADGFEVGKNLTVEQFEEGDKVNIQSVSKGKGYQGVVKRHGFAGSPASHGHRHDLRAPGSIGSAFPERVMKGKKMAGRMGGGNVTIESLKVSLVDKERNIIAVKGPVSGTNGTVVRIICEK
ncbi:MAG: 50S ribosomal protein L3 [Patescibacteria group bacterium]|nr:50S ribosomal protein L3 [Patescibacteria group bacterium]